MKRAPAGFRTLGRLSPFNALVGPLYAKSGGKASFVTAHLAVDFAGAARVGDWIEAEVEIQRMGTRLAFANCYLVADSRRIVRASAIFARTGD